MTHPSNVKPDHEQLHRADSPGSVDIDLSTETLMKNIVEQRVGPLDQVPKTRDINIAWAHANRKT